MNKNLKQAMDLAAPTNTDARDSKSHANGQERTMLNPVLSETELSSQKETPQEASAKNDALHPLLS